MDSGITNNDKRLLPSLRPAAESDEETKEGQVARGVQALSPRVKFKKKDPGD